MPKNGIFVFLHLKWAWMWFRVRAWLHGYETMFERNAYINEYQGFKALTQCHSTEKGDFVYFSCLIRILEKYGRGMWGCFPVELGLEILQFSFLPRHCIFIR